ncbi:MAG: sigma factor-like helix-turn-helix DNA-binding protein [Candidatus Zixiibacteriota bacterium]
MSDISDLSDFDRHITPHLGPLLEYSLVLTKNGRDATQILRAALGRTSNSWDVSVPCTSTIAHLQNELREECSAMKRVPRLTALWNHSRKDDRLKIENRLSAYYQNEHIRPVEPFDKTAIDRPYFLEVLADIPPRYRPAMFLSFLEGYSSSAIAELAGTEVHEIESTLYRGCRFARSRLPGMLMGDARPTPTQDPDSEFVHLTPWRGRWIR